MTRSLLLPLALCLVVAPALVSLVEAQQAWVYGKCTKCSLLSKADPRNCGGKSDENCGWDTANKFLINRPKALEIGTCTNYASVPNNWNQQDCAKYCFDIGQTGFIESQQGKTGQNVNYCFCCKEFCSQLQRKAGGPANILILDQNADAKHTSICEANATVEHDPHFVGAHGTKYDFNGQPGKTYNLVSTKDFQLNVKLIGYALDGSDSLHTPAAFEAGKQSVRTWMGEMGFLWTDAEGKGHSLHLTTRRSKDTSAPGLMSSITLDGAPIEIPTAEGAALDFAGARLDFLGVENERPSVGATEKWAINIGDMVTLNLKLDPAHPFIRMPEDAMTHFSLSIAHLQVSDTVHGVLGQTFRSSAGQVMKAIQYRILNALLREPIRADGVSGQGFLDGTADDYVTLGVLKADCKYCMYDSDV